MNCEETSPRIDAFPPRIPPAFTTTGAQPFPLELHAWTPSWPSVSRIDNLDASLPQGDARIAEIARQMGAKVEKEKGALVIASDGDKLHGGTFDLGDTPDLLPVVAALALRCDSPVEIVGTAHARFKETDRIAIVAKELSKLGVNVKERDDGLKILPQKGKLQAALMDAHDDHRMFMAFSLASMLIPEGAPVVGAESLDVSYPPFLEDIKKLGAKVKSE